MADGYNGLVIIDISDPTAPIYAGGYDTPGEALGIAVHGNYSFVADGWNGILIFKILKDPPSQGNLILCTSGPPSGNNPLWPLSESLANMAYTTFLDLNYSPNFIYYITPNPYQDINEDGIFDTFVVDDFEPTVTDIYYAINEWAYNRLNNGPLYLYLTGLGEEDRFQVMPGQMLYSNDPNTPDNSLKYHLDLFQEGTDRDVICLFEFTSSGTFCDDLIDANTLPYSRNHHHLHG